MGSPNKGMAYVRLPTQKTRLEVKDRDTSVASETSTYFSTRKGMAIANVFKLPLISPEDKAKVMPGTMASPKKWQHTGVPLYWRESKTVDFGST